MRGLTMILVLTLIISCGDQDVDITETLKAHPELIGTWTGDGRLLDMNSDKKVGELRIEIKIGEDNSIVGSIGDAKLLKAEMNKADYGFGIKAKLDSKVNKEVDFNKDHFILLLVTPIKNEQGAYTSDANFHLKSNYIFDFGMRVGGVMLNKE